MEESKVSTGSDFLDTLLEGGYEKDVVTTVYGPGGSGKTNICIIAAVSMVKSGKKVVYVDTEGGFSVERLKQIDPDYKETVKGMMFLKPISFAGQKKAFEKLKEIVNENIGLIIVDTIANLYRLELAKKEEKYSANRELGLHLSYLSEIARKKKIPVLVTSQVYQSFDDGAVRVVGGDVLKYGSKCLIELQKYHNGKRKAVLIKHRSIPEKKEVLFEITSEGLRSIKCENE